MNQKAIIIICVCIAIFIFMLAYRWYFSSLVRGMIFGIKKETRNPFRKSDGIVFVNHRALSKYKSSIKSPNVCDNINGAEYAYSINNPSFHKVNLAHRAPLSRYTLQTCADKIVAANAKDKYHILYEGRDLIISDNDIYTD